MKGKKRGNRSFLLLIVVGGVIAGAALTLLGELAGFDIIAKDAMLTTSSVNKCRTDQKIVNRIRSANGAIAALTAVEYPQNLSKIKFTNADRQTKSLDDWQGAIALVNIWATWCVPCREEMPALNALKAKLKANNINAEIITISIDNDTENRAANFYRDYKINNLALYRDKDMYSFYEIKSKGLGLGIPTTLIIDKNSCAIAKMAGPAAWDAPEAVKLLADLSSF